ncbi:MAG: UTP--glucose-1-phosphate uridylyltransferase GalU [Magnetococcales bacterium]|nr:UTP--glucose-1-phosphate uridylyltransferase GalU [Magnetococcales bacterium]
MTIRTAVLPVAGLGTRFLPITKSLPKEMLPVVDAPLIQYVVEEAWSAGMEQVVLVSSRGKAILEDHFDTSPELESALEAKGAEALLATLRELTPAGVGRIASVRQSAPLGLGHAVLCARAVVGNEPFAVLLPDDLIWTEESTPTVLRQMVDAFQHKGSSLVAVMEVDPSQTDKYGVIDPVDREIKPGERLIQTQGLVEKPEPAQAPSNLAVIGRYILTPDVFDLLENGKRGAGGEIQLTDAICALLPSQSVYGYRFEGTRFDCGDKVGYQMANLALSLHRPEMRERLLPFLQEQLAHWGGVGGG